MFFMWVLAGFVLGNGSSFGGFDWGAQYVVLFLWGDFTVGCFEVGILSCVYWNRGCGPIRGERRWVYNGFTLVGWLGIAFGRTDGIPGPLIFRKVGFKKLDGSREMRKFLVECLQGWPLGYWDTFSISGSGAILCLDEASKLWWDSVLFMVKVSCRSLVSVIGLRSACVMTANLPFA